MTNLDMLLLKGASSGTTEENLEELRYTILTKGIPANSEGMVSFPKQCPSNYHVQLVHHCPDSSLIYWFPKKLTST
jgi:hypothetical protein